MCHTIATIQSFFIISIVYYNDPDRIFAKAAPGYVTSVLLSGLIASIVQVSHFSPVGRLGRWAGYRLGTEFTGVASCWDVCGVAFLPHSRVEGSGGGKLRDKVGTKYGKS